MFFFFFFFFLFFFFFFFFFFVFFFFRGNQQWCARAPQRWLEQMSILGSISTKYKGSRANGGNSNFSGQTHCGVESLKQAHIWGSLKGKPFFVGRGHSGMCFLLRPFSVGSTFVLGPSIVVCIPYSVVPWKKVCGTARFNLCLFKGYLQLSWRVDAAVVLCVEAIFTCVYRSTGKIVTSFSLPEVTSRTHIYRSTGKHRVLAKSRRPPAQQGALQLAHGDLPPRLRLATRPGAPRAEPPHEAGTKLGLSQTLKGVLGIGVLFGCFGGEIDGAEKRQSFCAGDVQLWVGTDDYGASLFRERRLRPEVSF